MLVLGGGEELPDKLMEVLGQDVFSGKEAHSGKAASGSSVEHGEDEVRKGAVGGIEETKTDRSLSRHLQSYEKQLNCDADKAVSAALVEGVVSGSFIRTVFFLPFESIRVTAGGLKITGLVR